MEIHDTLRHFVIENFLFGRNGDLKDDDSFLEKGIIDSTGVLELIAFIEQRFAIQLQDSDLIPENLDSIQRVEQFIRRRLGAASGASDAG